MIIVEGKIQDRIAIVCGRFQPLTKAHYAMMKKLISRYQQVFIFPVQGPGAYTLKAKTEKGKASERARKIYRSPLPVGIRTELISKALPQVPQSNIMKLGFGSIVVAIDAIKRHHPKVDVSKVDVWSGPDQYNSYVDQLSYLKEPYDIKVKKFDVGTREEVSGTKLRKAIVDPNEARGFSVYKKVVAPPLADEVTFHKLRKFLTSMLKQKSEDKIYKFLRLINEEMKLL